MHVYIATGVVFAVAIAILASLVFHISLDIIATIAKWFFGILLALGLLLHTRHSKREEERKARMSARIEQFRE